MPSRTDHYATTFGDKGWGCGFRNVQMLLSCLLHSTLYRLTQQCSPLFCTAHNIGTECWVEWKATGTWQPALEALEALEGLEALEVLEDLEVLEALGWGCLPCPGYRRS